MRKLKIYFGDLSYHNRHTLTARYTPLNVGFLAQYIEQKFAKDVTISIYKEVSKFLSRIEIDPPDVVGLSLYYWNTELTRYAVDYIRNRYGDKIKIFLGGPSIDSDITEQEQLLKGKFHNVDAIVENEGELGFFNLVDRVIASETNTFTTPIDGATFVLDGQLVKGKPVGTTLDISQLGSPYLSHLMDDFLDSDYQPLVQTSRLCPYTCAFCVSGKTRGKLRGFNIEQVKDEITYVAKKYADKPHHTLYLADENFGILKRDVGIAEHIAECSKRYGYPKKVFFYNDKNFSGTSQTIVEILGGMNMYGLTLALQTENPTALKAINRKNVNEEKMESVIGWAKEKNISTTTELIFGLPYETRDSFTTLLDRSVKRGFDKILCHNLFIMDGIELNRRKQREQFSLETKYRLLGSNYEEVDGSFVMEHEEVVVKSDSFDYDDYSYIRNINFLFYAIFVQDFERWFFKYLVQRGVVLSEFVLQFFSPPNEISWPAAYLRFLQDFRLDVENEQFESREELYRDTHKAYLENGNQVGRPSRINVYFGSRLIYLEKNWIKEVLMKHVEYLNSQKGYSIDCGHADFLIRMGEVERVDLRGDISDRTLSCEYDISTWIREGFRTNLGSRLEKYQMVSLSTTKDQQILIGEFYSKFFDLPDSEFYYSAVDMINPSHLLRYELT